MELWKDIKGYEGLYQISSLGRVKSLSRITKDGKHIKEKIRKIAFHSATGYKFIGLYKYKTENKLIHRLVAEAFIPNPLKLSDVNHLNGVKTDNRVENLEWVSRSRNLKHAIEIGLVESQCKVRRKVIIEKDNKIIKFNSIQECNEYFGFKKCWLHNKIRKYGCAFNYKGYSIKVFERESGV